MNLRATRLLCMACVTLPLALTAVAGVAQGYPLKPVRIVVSGTAGGAMDLIGRAVAQRLADNWEQQVLVENRPAAAGVVAAEQVSRAPADGYTLLVIANGFTIRPGLGMKVPYDTLEDFAPIALLGRTPHVLVVHPSVPAKSVRELITLSHARPGQLTYGSPGVATSPHIAVEMLEAIAGIRMVHVPFQGGVPAMTALAGGHINVMFSNVAEISRHVETGRIRALAVAINRRVEHLPQVPTMAEAGVQSFESAAWFGLVGPAATPREIVTRINASVARNMQAPAMRAQLAAQALYVGGETPEQFGAFIRSEIAKYTRLLKPSDMKLE